MAAIERFAKTRGFEIVGTFSDDAVSGEDDIGSRPGFAAMLDALEANGTKAVIVEDASRFARKVIVQEVGIAALIERGVACWAAAGEVEPTSDEDETKVAMRQIAAVFSQLEKARLVRKLREARIRKRKDTGRKVEGRKSIVETRPEVAALARELAARRKPRLSLLKIPAALAEAGFTTSKGKSFSASQVSRMVAK
jgi:DNA invertase Pin-like site-specific DNA recombinase